MITIQRKVWPVHLATVDENLPAVLDIKLDGVLLGRMTPDSKREWPEWVPAPVIVGAGPSGLATEACLQEKGVPSLILEREDCIASSWKRRTYDRLRMTPDSKREWPEWVPAPVIVGAGPSGLATEACLQEKGVPSLILEREDCIASSWKRRTYDRLRMTPDSKREWPEWVLGPVIVGAGPSGLATAACLQEKGVPSLILEREDCIASSWKLRTYDRLRLHLPKQFSELPLMAFPPDFPTYPTKQQFISYLEAYAERFSIKPMFGMEVRCAEYDPSIGFWRVRVRANDQEFVCRWLVVATGENAEAVHPEFDARSDFRGRVIHSSSYKSGEDFQGQKVLVVGCGNSGMEVCLDLCNNGARASMVVRDKLHILPREILGGSTFGLSMWLLKYFPIRWVDRFLLLCSKVLLGDTERFGLERPKLGPLQLKNTAGKTPVLDVGALAKIKTGQIKVVPGIRRFTEDGVEFVDGRTEAFESVILATGYRSNVPSWLKENEFFSNQDGFPSKPFPNSWIGKDGLYATGFTRRGLLGASMDAHRIADHIACQWDSKTKPLPFYV